MQDNTFFAAMKPSRLFFKVAIPGMVSMLAMSIYSIIEGIFVGQLLGEAAFAAINIAMPFVMINFSLADLVGVGASVPISISLGRGETERAHNIFTCALLMIFTAAVVMGVFLFTGAPTLVRLMGAEGDLAGYAIRYVRIYALMGPVSTMTFAMDNFLRICGFVRGSMCLNILSTVLTISFLALFLMGLGMSVEGSALASALSMSICVMIGFVPFLLKKTILKFVRPRFSFGMVKQIVLCGLPVFLNNIAGRIASIIMTVVLLRQGGQTAVAAYSVLMYAGDIIQPMLYGMSDSTQPAVGYNWGARALDRVRDIAKCSFIACFVVSLVGTAVMFFFPAQIASLFVKPEETALLAMSVHGLRLFATAFLFRWYGFVVQGFFSAIEKPLPASILSVASAMVFPVLLVFALMPLGLDGLWLNYTGTCLLVDILAFGMLLYAQKRMKRDILK